jgi:TPR repeat protein
VPNDSTPNPSPPSNLQSIRTDAAAGNAEAQFGLGLFLAAGTAPNAYPEAFQWYQKAADQNHRLAQFNLGQMFAHGHGIPKSDSMAVMWIKRAAQGGDAGAQFEMGIRSGRASFQASDVDATEARVESYKWFTLAAVGNYRDALVRSGSATMGMTREEVTEGNHRVKTFVAS